jgi:hypothetical protein
VPACHVGSAQAQRERWATYRRRARTGESQARAAGSPMESRLARPSGQCAFSRGSRGKSREVGAEGCRALHVWLGGRGDDYDGRSGGNSCIELTPSPSTPVERSACWSAGGRADHPASSLGLASHASVGPNLSGRKTEPARCAGPSSSCGRARPSESIWALLRRLATGLAGKPRARLPTGSRDDAGRP